uniref:Uncharacterized protein n=1 Tax=Melanopsichium pennsylvanicum 4 TaxID=1398559 RepID=A0A077R3P8_9BASI|nr:uncharacterized protein BN887_06119 [Melanopsichium pennsylvanicum 4]
MLMVHKRDTWGGDIVVPNAGKLSSASTATGADSLKRFMIDVDRALSHSVQKVDRTCDGDIGHPFSAKNLFHLTQRMAAQQGRMVVAYGVSGSEMTARWSTDATDAQE